MKPLGLRPIRHQYQGTDERQAHRTPYCRVHNTPGNPSYGIGAGYIGWDTVDYDTDDMSQLGAGQPYLRCNTKGVYWAQMHNEFVGGAAATADIWIRILINSGARMVGGETDRNNVYLFGRYFDFGGWWIAEPGDTIAMYTYVGGTPLQLNGGVWYCWLSAHWISSN